MGPVQRAVLLMGKERRMALLEPAINTTWQMLACWQQAGCFLFLTSKLHDTNPQAMQSTRVGGSMRCDGVLGRRNTLTSVRYG
jgi:hypothetical protein